MKNKILLATLLISLTGCATVEKALYTDNGHDDPTTPEVNEGIVLNPVITGAIDVTRPIANNVPFGSLVYGVLSTLLLTGVEVKRRKATTGLKVAAIAIEKIAESAEGQELAKAVKERVNKLANKHGVSKEIDKAVKAIS